MEQKELDQIKDIFLLMETNLGSLASLTIKTKRDKEGNVVLTYNTSTAGEKLKKEVKEVKKGKTQPIKQSDKKKKGTKWSDEE